jgi:ubiquinol oxidase
MTIKQPSIVFRALVLGIQGVFFNIFFLSYMISPSAAHRFVGYLEEEACITYTRCIEDMKRGWIPEWEGVKAPGIAIVSFWFCRGFTILT